MPQQWVCRDIEHLGSLRSTKRLELLSAAPRATLMPLSCSASFLRAQYLDIRTLTHELIVNFCHSPQFCFNLIIKLGTCINNCSGICLFNKHWKDMSGRETSAWQLLIKSYSLTFCGTITSWFDGRVYYEKKTYITKTDNNNKQTKTYTAKEILYSLDVSFSRLRKLLAI